MDVDLNTAVGPNGTLVEQATRLLGWRLVDPPLDPHDVVNAADEIVRSARSPRHRLARALAHRAAGLALLDLGRLTHAARRAERSVADARSAGDDSVLAGCLTTAGALIFLDGRGDIAFAMLDEAVAAAVAVGDVATEFDATAQRTWMLQRAGRWRDALGGVESLLTRTHPPDEVDDCAETNAVMRAMRAELMADRANILADLSRYDQALAAFDMAIAELIEWPGPVELAEVQRNRAVCLTHAGQIPEAMAAFADLAAPLAGSPARRLRHLVALAELLLDARVVDEALQVTAEAVALDRRTVRPEQWAEAQLMRARALFQSGGDRVAAVSAARVAARSFTRAGVVGRAAVARALAARGAPISRRVAELAAAASDLHRAGLRDEAIATRVEALTTAVAIGDRARCRRPAPGCGGLPRHRSGADPGAGVAGRGRVARPRRAV